MRDKLWLTNKLDTIWDQYFQDIPRLNQVDIHFGRRAKRRLASIRQLCRKNKHSDTEITVTSFYKDEKVPEAIVDVTIAHELCHYAHGFASPLRQYSKYPHRGDAVDKELKKRGLGEQLKYQEKWLKANWNNIVNDLVFRPAKRKIRQRKPKRYTFSNLIKDLGLNFLRS